jgi:hypothetical protein
LQSISRLTINRGCVTPKQIGNVKDETDGDLSLFDGFDDLPEDIQERVQRAIEQGHVDDADWKGVSRILTRYRRVFSTWFNHLRCCRMLSRIDQVRMECVRRRRRRRPARMTMR